MLRLDVRQGSRHCDGITRRDWLRVDPFSTDARAARITCLLALGNKAEARVEFSRVEALDPAELGELRIRFERKLKE